MTKRTKSEVAEKSTGWLGSSIGIGYGAHTRGELGVELLLFYIKGAKRNGSGLDASLGRCSGHVQLGGLAWEDPGHAGERLFL